MTSTHDQSNSSRIQVETSTGIWIVSVSNDDRRDADRLIQEAICSSAQRPKKSPLVEGADQADQEVIRT
ncbi:MAG: hypothetical protein CMN94_03065 [Synechococcus sp. EAC657]|nr:hypothetical protein [Synechococcus sp. EAC657]